MGQAVSCAEGFCGQVEDARLPRSEEIMNSPVGQAKELPRLLGSKEVDMPSVKLKVEKETSHVALLQEVELDVPEESVEIEVPQEAASVLDAVRAEDSTAAEDLTANSNRQDTEKQMTTERSVLLKAQKKAERAEAKTQISSFLQQNGFTSVKSKKTWLWRVYYPLHVAVEKNDLDALKTLLKAGADTKKKNHRGQTPLQLASRLNKKGDRAVMMQALVTATAKANKALEKKRRETTQPTPKPKAGAASSSWEPVAEPGTQ